VFREVLHAHERAIYVASLTRRSVALTRLLSTSSASAANPVVLAMFVGNLLRAAIPLCGADLAAELFSWLARQVREQCGLCPLCGATRAPGAGLCDTCRGEMDRVDQELQLELADPRAPQ
jgi:hypothetical protein